MILALLVASLAALEPSALPKKATFSLREAVEASTFVCIGRVDEIRTITVPRDARTPEDGSVLHTVPDSAPFARIRVERVLKGDRDAAVVHHEVWRSWACDTTTTAVGQRAVFFLAPGLVAHMPVSARDALRADLGGAPVLRNFNSGDGVVVIEGDESDAWVRWLDAPDALRVPRALGVPIALARDHDELRIPLGAFVGHVENLCRFDRAECAVIARSSASTSSGAPFDFRILPSGDTLLAIDVGRDGETLRTGRIATAAWGALRSELASIAVAGDVDARANTRTPARSLTTAIDARSIRFVDDGRLDAASMSPARRAEFRSAIRAWKVVTNAMDCATCACDDARDAAWFCD